jgi:hypothetical protein
MCLELKTKRRALRDVDEKLNQTIRFIDYFCTISTISSIKSTTKLDKLYCNIQGQPQIIDVYKKRKCINLREKELRYSIDSLINRSTIVQSL